MTLGKGIVVLDFGGQYAHLIANRIRKLQVYAEIRSPEIEVEELADADGIILSGGPSSVYAADSPAYNPQLFTLDKPMLGLCYGHQLICQQLGGKVERGGTMEFGAAHLRIREARGVLAGLEERAGRLGIPFALVVFPDRILVDADLRRLLGRDLVAEGYDLQRLRGWIEANVEGPPVFDTAEVLRGGSEHYRGGDTHLSDLGNLVAGEWVGERLATLLFPLEEGE